MNDTKKTEETKSTQERMKEAHDTLRRELLNKFQVCGDYACPEAESGFASGVFVAEPDFEALSEFCKYVSAAGTFVYDGEWGADALFTFIKNKLVNYHNGDNYDITLSFGGMQPVLALFPFLLSCSEITGVSLDFTHDKWESRGDHTSKKRVGIGLRNGQLVVGDSKKIKRQATGTSTAKKKNSDGYKSNVVLSSREMRSREYDVEQISGSEYRVTSKDKEHIVIERDGYFWCDCGDFRNEPKNCKHIVAVKRFMNEPFVLSEDFMI